MSNHFPSKRLEDPCGTICDFCLDIGVCRVIDRADNHETLMRCECREGVAQTYKLRQWHYKIGQVFSRGPCPVAWFKPDITEGTLKLESMNRKIEYWRAKVSLAEMYWAQFEKETA